MSPPECTAKEADSVLVGRKCAENCMDFASCLCLVEKAII